MIRDRWSSGRFERALWENFDQAYEILYRAKIQTGDLQGAIGALEREAKMLISGSWFDIQKVNEVLAPKQVIFEIRSLQTSSFYC